MWTESCYWKPRFTSHISLFQKNNFILDFRESVKMSILFWVQFLAFAFLAILQVEARPSASGDVAGDQDTYIIQEAVPLRHFYNLPTAVSLEHLVKIILN